MTKLYLYAVSADNWKTVTKQWLTEAEAEEHRKQGYRVAQYDKNLHFKYV